MLKPLRKDLLDSKCKKLFFFSMTALSALFLCLIIVFAVNNRASQSLETDVEGRVVFITSESGISYINSLVRELSALTGHPSELFLIEESRISSPQQGLWEISLRVLNWKFQSYLEVIHRIEHLHNTLQLQDLGIVRFGIYPDQPKLPRVHIPGEDSSSQQLPPVSPVDFTNYSPSRRCDKGFRGEYCEECASGHFGTRCEECSVDCSGQGVCNSGYQGTDTCVCMEGFTGTDCSEAVALVERVSGINVGFGTGPSGWEDDKNYQIKGGDITQIESMAEYDAQMHSYRVWPVDDFEDAPILDVMDLPVPEAGLYAVRLFFAEVEEAYFAPGARVFSVYLEGKLVKENIDIFSRVGSFTPLVIDCFGEDQFVEVNDGFLTVALQQVVGDAVISGIEVVRPTSIPAMTFPSLVNVGQVPAFSTESASFILRNPSLTPATVTSLRFSPPTASGFLSLPPKYAGAFTLPPRTSVEVAVTFRPVLQGDYFANVEVYVEGSESPVASLSISGEGGPPLDSSLPSVLMAPNMDFQEAYRDVSKSALASIMNAGEEAVTFRSVFASSLAFQVDLRGLKLPFTLQPNDAVDVEVSFTPTGVGAYSDVLTLVAEGPREDFVLSSVLSGDSKLPVKSVLRLNSGSFVSYIDENGVVWSGDKYFREGSISPGSIGIESINLFSIERYWSLGSTPDEGKAGYEIPASKLWGGGEYYVKLYFVELKPGLGRKFKVSVNGHVLMQELDIASESARVLAETGGESEVVVLESGLVTVGAGESLLVEFEHLFQFGGTETYNNPKINAVEVFQVLSV